MKKERCGTCKYFSGDAEKHPRKFAECTYTAHRQMVRPIWATVTWAWRHGGFMSPSQTECKSWEKKKK